MTLNDVQVPFQQNGARKKGVEDVRPRAAGTKGENKAVECRTKQGSVFEEGNPSRTEGEKKKGVWGGNKKGLAQNNSLR